MARIPNFFAKPRRFARRFARDRRGATAIEFSMVALPFFALIFAIIETTVVFFAQETLQNAVMDTSRMIRTGQVQSNNLTVTEFKQLVCDRIDVLMACDDRLQIDVRTFPAFNNVSFEDMLDAEGNYNANFVFDAGGAGDIVVMRVFYAWDVVTPALGADLSNMAGGRRLIEASAAFRNEPYEGVM